MIHTLKGFGIVNKAEIDVFLGLSCFFDDPEVVGNLISGSSAFSKTSLNTASSWFMYSWAWLGEFWALLYQRVRWVQLCGSLIIFGIAFLWDWKENWPFPAHTVEVINRFKGLDLIDRVLDELWTEVWDIVQEIGSKTIPKKKKCKMALWEGLQIAVRREAKSKGEKERYTRLIAEFQRIARRDKKAFLSDQYK